MVRKNLDKLFLQKHHGHVSNGELLIIIVILIGVVLIFKEELTNIVYSFFTYIESLWS